VVVPVRTASAISGEKERQTFDIMMTTSMTGFSIIMGKVLTAMIQSMFYVVAGLPIVALAFVIGGLSWGNLFSGGIITGFVRFCKYWNFVFFHL
jgi:ABC-2 type transport system permease protein